MNFSQRLSFQEATEGGGTIEASNLEEAITRKGLSPQVMKLQLLPRQPLDVSLEEKQLK